MNKLIILAFAFTLILLAMPMASADLTEGLVSYYKLDEISGTTAVDSHGLNNGTANDARIFTSEVAGIINTGADFAQGQDTINISANVFNFNEGSFQAWVKHNGTTGGNIFTSSGSNFMVLRIATDNRLQFHIEGSGVSDSRFKGNTVLSANVFYHIVLTSNGTAYKLYVNGVEETLTFDLGANTGNWGAGINPIITHIGSFDTFQFFNGVLDEIAIWNTTINQTEILELYADGNGKQYPFALTSMQLLSPSDNTITISRDINFTAEFLVPEDWTRLNATLYLWNSTGGLVRNQTKNLTTIHQPDWAEAGGTGSLTEVNLAFNSTIVRAGQRINLNNQRISRIGFRFYTESAPTGQIYYRIRDSNTDNIIEECLLGNAIDFASPNRYFCDFEGVLINGDVRISVEREGFSGSSGALRIQTAIQGTSGNQPQIQGFYSDWGGSSWSDSPNDDIVITIEFAEEINFQTETNLPLGTYFWNVEGFYEDDESNINSTMAGSNFTFEIQPFKVISESFNPFAFETSRQEFRANITTIPAILATTASLVYNGQSFFVETNCVTGECELVANIDIPLVVSGTSQNKTFFWNLILFDGANSFEFNTTQNEQNVSRIFLESCGGNATIQAINFTAWDEQNLTRINPFNFRATFQSWLGNGDVKRISTFDNTNIAERTVCINPSNHTFFADADIEYDITNQTLAAYNTRNYYLRNATVTNQSSDIFLYLLNASSSTTFILAVQNENQQPVPGALIHIQRYYPGTNQFRTVQIAKTGDSGESVGFYQTETVDYKHLIIKEGQVLLEVSPQKIVPKDAPFTLTFTLGEALPIPWQRFLPNPNIQSSLTFNDTTKIVTFSYVDVTGMTTTGRLLVREIKMAGSPVTICDTSLPLSAGTITCNLSEFDSGNFEAYGYVESGTTLAHVLNFIITTFRDIMDRTGLFMAFLIILTSFMVFIFNPTAGIVSVNATVLFVNLIGLATFAPVYIFALMGVSVIAIILLNT